MTSLQKEQIAHLRGQGESYGKIAIALGLSENTVKTYCRRNQLSKSCPTSTVKEAADACDHCGRRLRHTPKAKKKRFCGDKCRMAWWNAHPEAVRRKAVYHFACSACGRSFDSYGNKNRKYCSRACAQMARRVSNDKV